MNCLEKIRVSTVRTVTSKLKKVTMLGVLFLGITPVLAQEASIEKYDEAEAKKNTNLVIFKKYVGIASYETPKPYVKKNVELIKVQENPDGTTQWQVKAYQDKGIYYKDKQRHSLTNASMGFVVSQDIDIIGNIIVKADPDLDKKSDAEKEVYTFDHRPYINQITKQGNVSALEQAEYLPEANQVNERIFKDVKKVLASTRTGYVVDAFESGGDERPLWWSETPLFTSAVNPGEAKVNSATKGKWKRDGFDKGFWAKSGAFQWNAYTINFITKPKEGFNRDNLDFSGVIGTTGSWQDARFPFDAGFDGEVPEKKYDKVKLIIEERFFTNSTLPVSIPAINNVVINKGKTHVKNEFSEVLTKTEDFEKADNISNGDKRTHEYLIKDFIPADWDEVGLEDYKNSLSVTGVQLNGYSTKEIEKSVSREDGIKTIKIVYTHTKLVCTKISAVGTPENTLVGISTLNRENGNWNLNELGAYLALESNTKGFVITRNADPETNITSPTEGMIVWDTTKNCLRLYSGKAGTPQWNCISQGCNETGTTN